MYIEAIQYVVSKNGRTFHNEQSTDYSVLFMGRDRSRTGSTRIADLNKNGINWVDPVCTCLFLTMFHAYYS